MHKGSECLSFKMRHLVASLAGECAPGQYCQYDQYDRRNLTLRLEIQSAVRGPVWRCTLELQYGSGIYIDRASLKYDIICGDISRSSGLYTVLYKCGGLNCKERVYPMAVAV